MLHQNVSQRGINGDKKQQENAFIHLQRLWHLLHKVRRR